MLIDWFTVGAQVLNFLILVWLMKRFLYKPILHAIDVREQRIAKELADADTKKAEAQKERDTFQLKNEAFDQERAELLSKTKEDADSEKQRLLAEARTAADALSAKRQETLRNEAQTLNQALARQTQDVVLAIARKTLTDLSTASLEAQMVDVFSERLRSLGDEAKQILAEALNAATEPALIRSAFDLPADQRTKLQTTLNETFAAEVPIRFETAPDLVSGIELSASGQKIAWSIADYLTTMEKGIGELLKVKAPPKVKAEQKQPQLDTQRE